MGVVSDWYECLMSVPCGAVWQCGAGMRASHSQSPSRLTPALVASRTRQAPGPCDIGGWRLDAGGWRLDAGNWGHIFYVHTKTSWSNFEFTYFRGQGAVHIQIPVFCRTCSLCVYLLHAEERRTRSRGGFSVVRAHGPKRCAGDVG